MYKILRAGLLITMLWLCSRIAIASNALGDMYQLTTADGLCGNSIGKVLLGSDGRAWVAAGYGISVFDGYCIDLMLLPSMK